ncbi:hypothetical protein N1851_014165 [Merluccius polli]|uniref:Uncharacterized protein n=1 Tax=Merluccius polli TaxID=89951 RepID=A0AA47MTW5_MERPO|nr:hypothetical protein N1851_014165 [Merluccius polli]
MSSDSNPAFQRLFFKSLQVCLGELFQARLGELSSGQEAVLGAWFPRQGDLLTTSLLDRLHRPSRGVLSQHVRVLGFVLCFYVCVSHYLGEEAELQKRHSETSLFARVEELLREKN